MEKRHLAISQYKEIEVIFPDPSLYPNQTPKDNGLFWAEGHPPSQFNGNLSSSFSVILRTIQPPNKQTDSRQARRWLKIHLHACWTVVVEMQIPAIPSLTCHAGVCNGKDGKGGYFLLRPVRADQSERSDRG